NDEDVERACLAAKALEAQILRREFDRAIRQVALARLSRRCRAHRRVESDAASLAVHVGSAGVTTADCERGLARARATPRRRRSEPRAPHVAAARCKRVWLEANFDCRQVQLRTMCVFAATIHRFVATA